MSGCGGSTFWHGVFVCLFFIAPLIFGGGWMLSGELSADKRAAYRWARRRNRIAARYVDMGLRYSEAINRADNDMRREAIEVIAALEATP